METMTQEKIEVLARIQDLQIESRKLQAVIEKEEASLVELDEKLQVYETRVEETEGLGKDLKKQYRAYEEESRELLAKIAKSREKLQAVKTNKEYQSTLKEIDDIQKRHSNIEDEMIACLDRIEENEAAVGLAKEALAEAGQEIAEQKAAVAEESEAARRRIQDLAQKEAHEAGSADPELLVIYNRLRTFLGGTGVARAENGACNGCHMNIPPQMYNELQRGDSLKFCPHCERILYWRAN